MKFTIHRTSWSVVYSQNAKPDMKITLTHAHQARKMKFCIRTISWFCWKQTGLVVTRAWFRGFRAEHVVCPRLLAGWQNGSETEQEPNLARDFCAYSASRVQCRFNANRCKFTSTSRRWPSRTRIIIAPRSGIGPTRRLGGATARIALGPSASSVPGTLFLFLSEPPSQEEWAIFLLLLFSKRQRVNRDAW